jgi:hypothetical protein
MIESQTEIETASVLRQYVDGSLTTAELDGWLAEAEYDEDMPLPLRDLLASIRLTIVEAGEGTVSKEEVLTAVALALASIEPGETIVSQRASSSTTWGETARFTAAATHVVRARISAGTAA